ncbi:DUF6180 family protein [Alcaligenes faecalis]|nr:DUF6180 family protein [Alcaligenes faecalis]
MCTVSKWVLMAALLQGAWTAHAQHLHPLELEAEQRSISRLSVAQCVDTVRQTAAGEGYHQRTDPSINDELGVYIGAAPLGGGSLVVYCIDLKPSTAYMIHTRAQVSAELMSPHQLNHKIAQALTVAAQP